MKRNWPSREEFLKSRQGPCYDVDMSIECSRYLVHYATPAEIRTLHHELRERYRALGREMQQIKAALDPQALQQQRGEGWLTYFHRRVPTMPPSDQARVRDMWECRWRRRDINRVLRDIDRGKVSSRSDICAIGEKPPLLVAIVERYEAAYRAARTARWAEIDEKHWQHELKRRASIEAQKPEVSVHRTW